ncbi:MAG: V-type ATP synthase subunit E [Thaumarchaeota archaeon]|nr:MAG: V-type ATP synthase subunit E [Nitrososphaerota archaeon]
MTSNLSLEQAIDTVLQKTENDILLNLKNSSIKSKETLDNSLSTLEGEFDKIISDGNKEADKIEKQIIGSADLEARNKQLMTLEEGVNKVFSKALDEITNTARSGDYSNLIKSLLDESTKILGTTEVIVSTNTKDKDLVQSTLSQFPGSELSSELIDCLGGVIIKSKDGTTSFDNTLDARIERLKPLIRKEIASQFGVGT